MKFLTFLLAALLGAAPLSAQKLVIKGSDTLGAKMVPQAAEAFRAKHPGTVFEIAAEGSSTGIAALIEGTADIAMSSRRARPSEMAAAQSKGVIMKPIIVCYDAITVIVNANNPVSKLTMRQVEQIFTGDVRDWSAVGGNPGPISIYTRNTASGTFQDFKDLAMKRRDYAPVSQMMAGNEQIASEVANNPNGIGYVGIAYAKTPGVKAIGVINAAGKLVLPSNETVHDKSYPYARPNFFYTNGEPDGLNAELINFLSGREGREIVEQAGFVPVPTKS